MPPRVRVRQTAKFSVLELDYNASETSVEASSGAVAAYVNSFRPPAPSSGSGGAFVDAPSTFCPQVAQLLDLIVAANPLARRGYEQVLSSMPYVADQARLDEYVRIVEEHKELSGVERRVCPSIATATPVECVMDFRVRPRGRPDDAVYANDRWVRQNVPRGNCIARLAPSDGQEHGPWLPLLRAYPKFTGHEDDGEVNQGADMPDVTKFFTKPRNEARVILSTRKENGEAAHLSVIERSDGAFVLIAGSKNVHLLAISEEDVGCAEYADDAYRAARNVARTVFAALRRTTAAQQWLMLKFLAESRVTVQFELLDPHHQHVELFHMTEPELVLTGFSLLALEKPPGSELCLNPVFGYDLFSALGWNTVRYAVVPMTDLDSLDYETQQGYQEEGRVNLFLDDQDNVIGMQKSKTYWYIAVRAIREQVRGMISNMLNPKRRDASRDPEAVARERIARRMRAIKVWQQADDSTFEAYSCLADGFVSWLLQQEVSEHLLNRVAMLYPVVWRQYLDETGQDDRIQYRRGS